MRIPCGSVTLTLANSDARAARFYNHSSQAHWQVRSVLTSFHTYTTKRVAIGFYKVSKGAYRALSETNTTSAGPLKTSVETHARKLAKTRLSKVGPQLLRDHLQHSRCS